MKLLLEAYGNTLGAKKIEKIIQNKKTPLAITQTSYGYRAFLCAHLWKQMGKKVVFVSASERGAAQMSRDLEGMLAQEVCYFPPRDLELMPTAGRSYEWEHMRIRALWNLQSKKAGVIVAPLLALLQFAPDEKTFFQSNEVLRPGQQLEREDLLKKLEGLGYKESHQVEGIGQYSKRGYIVDFFPPHLHWPVRVEFFDNEIDSIATFDVTCQRREDNLKEVVLLPAREFLLTTQKKEGATKLLEKLIKHGQNEEQKEYLKEDLENLENAGELWGADRYRCFLPGEKTFLLDYFDEDTVVILEDYENMVATAKRQQDVLEQEMTGLVEKNRMLWVKDWALSFSFVEIMKQLKERAQPLIFAQTFSAPSQEECVIYETMESSSLEIRPFSGQTQELQSQVKNYMAKNYGGIVLCYSEERAKRLQDALCEQGLILPIAHEESPLPPKGSMVISVGNLSSGVEFLEDSLVFLCEGVATKEQGKSKKPKSKNTQKINSYFDLKPGDLIVHINHGIGQFLGVQQMTMEGITKDYLKINYQGGDSLYVPCNQLDLISKYVASQRKNLKLSKMGGQEWQKTKARVRAEAAEYAKELIELYAQREKIEGFAFPPENDLQRDFEARFPYEETDDQLRCTQEIKEDMEKSKPMDRLLCGDVGFGKTEVALRGAFKCLAAGKQVALMVPTTILCQQHYKTIVERFQDFPLNIVELSRFTTQKEKEQIMIGLKNGIIDMVVGTHSLLSPKISFCDLGLLIIDEEQRFGVTHKERLKEMSKNIDVLTLTATPIPRTLNMALSGIRDMSVLEDAPKDRQPVQTYVMAQNDAMIADAVRREMRRGGQVFYLHNKVDTIMKESAKIKELVPEARVVYAHGRMKEEELHDIFTSFIEQKADVLVCTTIIETGIDIPNANTLLIGQADHLGLAQLYQIRGRVGRSSRRAYAYLMYQPMKELTAEAAKRLQAIKEFTEFGSGFQLAMRDLEIRGAGNVLGTSQHGHMETVGYDLYLKLLSEAVAQEKGEEQTISISCDLDIAINAYLPGEYIMSGESRIEIYKKIAAIEAEEDAMDMEDELCDRFGEIPMPVLNLIEIALLRNWAARLGIEQIVQKGKEIIFTPQDLSHEIILKLQNCFQKRLEFLPGEKIRFAITLDKKEENSTLIREVLRNMD